MCKPFLKAPFRSILKVNEFTLAGAVLVDSFDRSADKKNGGEPTHSSPKSATFSKEYNTPASILQWIASPFQGSQRHCKSLLNAYCAQDIFRPCNPRAMASNCLILVVEIVEIPDRGQERYSESSLLLCTYPDFLEIKKAWS